MTVGLTFTNRGSHQLWRHDCWHAFRSVSPHLERLQRLYQDPLWGTYSTQCCCSHHAPPHYSAHTPGLVRHHQCHPKRYHWLQQLTRVSGWQSHHLREPQLSCCHSRSHSHSSPSHSACCCCTCSWSRPHRAPWEPCHCSCNPSAGFSCHHGRCP